MDVLINKKYKDFDYPSRNSGIPYYYHTLDDKYVFGLNYNLKKDTSYTLHEVKDTDTLDYLALKYYNNPTYYWVIALFNDIDDTFMQLSDYYKVIKIPTFTGIEFGDLR